jgi:hypothetical protein
MLSLAGDKNAGLHGFFGYFPGQNIKNIAKSLI